MSSLEIILPPNCQNYVFRGPQVLDTLQVPTRFMSVQNSNLDCVAIEVHRTVPMESSTWSDPQTDVTTELGGGSDVGEHVAANANDAPRRRCVVPKVRARQLNGSDQQVPVYWDQTVPVWSSCKEEARISSTSKRETDSLCRHGKKGGSGATTFFDNKSERCCCKCRREGPGRPVEHSALADGAAAGASEVGEVISPPVPMLVTSRRD